MARTFEIGCTVEIEKSSESLHAFVELDDDVDIRPGDQVMVHGAPTDVADGERRVVKCRATVTRAGWFDRQWTRVASLFDLTELYDVSFSDRRKL